MAAAEDFETTDVIICGCGPTGALLSAYLGQMSVPNIVLEKEKEIVTDPRGIALDEDGIRLLQGLGLYDKVHTEIGESIGWLYFTSGKRGLDTKPFMRMNLSTTEGGTGHVAGICHKQPVLEKNIRLAGSRCPSSQLRLGSTLLAIEENEHGVLAKYQSDDGTERWIRGKFLVGADGKTGFTRKNYLEPKGIVLETLPGYEYLETWVAANFHMDLPTPESHPDFPLWELGFTPQQVYDSFFPIHFRFIGNPDRPAVCGTFGLREERLWRFEFVVEKKEDPQEMASYEKSTEIIFPYLTHQGQRYGLEKPIQYPADCIHVLRSRPFTFSARSCNSWHLGRVILCGDSAHVMPPFGGQGIASGFRDASGIAWRLALACRPGARIDHESLFKGWCLERKQSLDASIASTVANGNLTTARNPLKIFCRDWILWAMQLIPSLRHKLELGPRAGGLPRYKWKLGMAFLPEFAGGKYFPQVYCRSIHPDANGSELDVQFTDDAIYRTMSNAPLRLVVLVDNMADLLTAQAGLQSMDLQAVSHNELKVDDTIFLVHEPSLGLQKINPTAHAYRIATGKEFSASKLCINRPKPLGYDMYRIKTEMAGKRYILVRPDRFVFAACSSLEELRTVCERMQGLLFGR